MSNKTIIVILLSLLVLFCCCTGAALAGMAFYSMPIAIDHNPILPTQGENNCVVDGCSNQLCISKEDSEAGLGVTTCEWLDSYGCFSYAICERQPSGECGWTAPQDFKQCLNDLAY